MVSLYIKNNQTVHKVLVKIYCYKGNLKSLVTCYKKKKKKKKRV